MSNPTNISELEQKKVCSSDKKTINVSWQKGFIIICYEWYNSLWIVYNAIYNNSLWITLQLFFIN